MTVLVTDSSALLTREEASAWGVHVVPLFYSVDNRPSLETFSGQNGDFAALLGKSAAARTSQPSPGAYLSVFDEILQSGSQALCLTLSSRLSGAFGSALAAAKEYPNEVAVVDSHLTAGGLYLLVKAAAEFAKAGLSAAEIAPKLYPLREAISMAFSVSDLTNLHKSGRMSRVRQSITTILNNRPLLLCENGAIVSDGVVRGKTAQADALFAKVSENASQIVVHHTGQEGNAAYALAARLRAARPAASVLVRALGPVLTIHLGFSVLGVAWM